MPVLRLGIYEHFKSTDDNPRYYEVVALARSAEAEEVVVVYRPLYDEATTAIEGISLYVRSLNNFTEEVQINGKRIPRFKFVDSTIEE